jgi:hypothetical protein
MLILNKYVRDFSMWFQAVNSLKSKIWKHSSIKEFVKLFLYHTAFISERKKYKQIAFTVGVLTSFNKINNFL